MPNRERDIVDALVEAAQDSNCIENGWCSERDAIAEAVRELIGALEEVAFRADTDPTFDAACARLTAAEARCAELITPTDHRTRIANAVLRHDDSKR